MQLNEGEDLYKTVINAPIGICILRADTLVAEIVNHKFLEVAGKPYESIFGQFYWDAFAEARPYYEAALAGVVKTGEPYHADEVELMLIRHGRQEIIFVTFVYAPIKDNSGKVSKIAVWVLENTKQVNERERVEAARVLFQKERDRLNRFFMQAPAGICILDGPEFVFELVNPGYQQLFPGRKLSGKPLLEAVPEVRDQPIWQVLQNVYRSGQTYEGNELLIPLSRTDGGPVEDRYFNFTYQARLDENDQPDGILVFVIEVTGMISVQHELRQAREQSDQQRRIYETITSNTPDLMYVFGLDYRFTYANSALLSMWGKSWDNAVGKSLLENNYEPWHAEMHEREIDQVKATRQPVRGEVSFPHATLGRRIYDYIFVPVIDQNGEVEAVAGTTRDITEQKESQGLLAKTLDELRVINVEMAAVNEEQAASNEELTAANEELAVVNQKLFAAQEKIEEREVALRLAINAANFGTWFIHSVTREFITDARLKELFGYYPEEDLSIEQALAQITDEYRGFVADKLENAIYHNGDYDVTYPVIGLHDNQLRWLRAIGNLKADASGAFSAFTGVVMDITQQHLASQKIEAAEEGLRMAIESGELAVWQLNENLDKINASARFNELFGFSPDEDVPYTAAVTQILPEYRQAVQDAVTASLINGADFNIEYPVTGFYDHKQRWVRSIGKYVSDEKNGNYITGVMADITEQKMDEIRKNDFIGMVSHELKTPLTSLTAIIQLLNAKLRTSDDAFVSGALEKANSQVKKMSGMINGFLNISRLESGKILIDKQPFIIGDLINEVIEEMSLMGPTHLIELQNCEKAVVHADRDKIASSLSNLLSNAIKYSPKNSQILVNCLRHDNEVQVSVTDQGLGIRPQDREYIFDRYYRVQSIYTKHISGFGIGLYLTSEIIQRHNGTIWVESESGKGSTFYFTLPLEGR
jgi:PAS domain S-box-containing protein